MEIEFPDSTEATKPVESTGSPTGIPQTPLSALTRRRFVCSRCQQDKLLLLRVLYRVDAELVLPIW